MRAELTKQWPVVNSMTIVIKIVTWVVVFFIIYPVVFGFFDNPYIKFFILLSWFILVIGVLSGILIEGIQQDLEHIRRGEDIVTGKKLRKD